MRSCWIAISFLFFCSFVFGQNTEENKTSISQSSKAVLFSFSGLDNLNATSYDGGLGFKIFTSDNLAVRVGIILNGTSTTTPANQDTTQNAVDGEASTFAFGLSGVAEYHLTKNPISPFVGGGIEIYTSSLSQKQPVTWSKNFTGFVFRSESETSNGLSLDIFALGGVEIFVIKTISLSAEYRLTFHHKPSPETTNTIRLIQGTSTRYPVSEKTKGTSSNSYSIATSGYLTLAVYF